MTADEFSMDPHYSIYHKETMWDVTMRDGCTKIGFEVYDDDVQKIIRDSFDYVEDSITKEILDRLDSKWDEGLISDEDKETFTRILKKVIG